MSATNAIHEYVAKDYKSSLKPIWCPGCGDFGVVSAVYRALANVGRPPHEIAFVSGIGCSLVLFTARHAVFCHHHGKPKLPYRIIYYTA